MNKPTLPRQRALVTGATGYIGAHLVKRLVADGWDVHVITRPDSDTKVLAAVLGQISCHPHDATTKGMIALVKAARPDMVFHLASLFLVQHTPDDIEALILSNILFSTQLVEAMTANEVHHLINTGTSWQHYQNQPYNPVNLYAATKQAFESVLEYYVQAHGLAVTTLALFDTYGPHDPRAKLISLLWKTAMQQQELAMSPGEQNIDLVHIDDVIDAYMLAAQQLAARNGGEISPHQKYGVSSGQRISLRTLVTQFEQATGTHLPIVWGGRNYRNREVMELWNSYLPVPGWAPKISFDTGIQATRPTLSATDAQITR